MERIMTAVSSAAPTNFNTINPSVANTGSLPPNQDAISQLKSIAAGSDPVAAGNALRQLDTMTGSATTTNAVIRDGTQIAGLPLPEVVSCDAVPKNLTANVTSLDGSLLPVGGGFFASGGKFTAPDLANGKVYHGFYGSAGAGVGLSVGVGGSSGFMKVGDIAGKSVVGSASTPIAGGTATFSTDGRLTGISGGPGARLGGYFGGAETTMFGCFSTPAPTIR
jgi:hypothetical protein